MTSTAAAVWENNIVAFEREVDPSQLLANPLNAWIHTASQQDAMGAALEQVGWTDCVKVNIQTGHVLDGHMRVLLALRAGQTVPVLYVSMDEARERLALSTHNLIAQQAIPDPAQFDALFAELRTDNLLQPSALSSLLDGLAADLNLIPGLPPEPPRRERGKDAEREATKLISAILDAAGELVEKPLTTPRVKQALRRLWHDPNVAAMMHAAHQAAIEG